jgi:flagellar biosynthetic protein FliR
VESLAPHLVPWLLLAFRLSGVFLLAPMLASTMIPAKVRVLLVFALAAAVYPMAPASAMPEAATPDLVWLAFAVTMEVTLGFVIGLLMMLPIAAVQMASVIMGQQMGFGLASVYNPTLETESDLLGELLIYLAIGAYILMGGLEVCFLAVLRTLDALPLGSVTAHMMPLDMVVGVLGAGLELALRVSGPLLAIIFLETLALSFIMKTMPQMNILSIGFALKIILGLGALIAGLAATDLAITQHVHEVARAVIGWSVAPHQTLPLIQQPGVSLFGSGAAAAGGG